MNDTDRSPDPDGIPRADPPPDRFERLAATIGDLDSPFYDEERDRDVWNEASAVGFQAMLWSLPIVAAAALWLGGASALPYVSALLVPWLLGATITLAYAHRRSVDPGAVEVLTAGRVRMAWFGVVLVALSGGYLWASAQLTSGSSLDSFVRGATQGGALGALAMLVVAAVLVVRGARRHRGTPEG
jgi:hypothetical protein